MLLKEFKEHLIRNLIINRVNDLIMIGWFKT